MTVPKGKHVLVAAGCFWLRAAAALQLGGRPPEGSVAAPEPPRDPAFTPRGLHRQPLFRGVDSTGVSSAQCDAGCLRAAAALLIVT